MLDIYLIIVETLKNNGKPIGNAMVLIRGYQRLIPPLFFHLSGAHLCGHFVPLPLSRDSITLKWLQFGWG